MDSMSAFMMGDAARRAGARGRVFDWVKAAQLIAERKPTVASAGLRGDWEYTGGTIYANGAPDVDSYTYLASNWAAPELDMDGDVIECWIYKDEAKWDSGTKWPAEALEILGVK